MILLSILAVPLAAGAMSFAANKRPAMEKINLGAFALVLTLAGILVAQVLRDGSVSRAEIPARAARRLTHLIVNDAGGPHRWRVGHGCFVQIQVAALGGSRNPMASRL